MVLGYVLFGLMFACILMAIYAALEASDDSNLYPCRMCGNGYGTLNGANLCCEPLEDNHYND